LLQQHHGALGGAQQQDGVDGGDVEAFVEQVDGEEGAQLARGLCPALRWRVRNGTVTPVALATCRQYICTVKSPGHRI
jgi:hypothetical protein